MNEFIEKHLSQEERTILLSLARQAILEAVAHKRRTQYDVNDLPPSLQHPGASFVTLTKNGNLRGCIGTLEPYQSLAADVCEHAIAAALQDFRFPPVKQEEIKDINIEISRLTIPVELNYSLPDELLKKITPHVDGVIINDGVHRATFLPQVWEKIPDGATFLGNLCQKMGAASDLWRRKKLQVLVYQVEEFHE